MAPIIKVDDVAYPTLQVPDLALQEKFLIDFGMTTVQRSDEALYMRGDGAQPFLHVSVLGEKRFLGTTFQASSLEDLERLSATESFGDVEELKSPGGGYRVSGHDADGIGVAVAYGIENRQIEGEIEDLDFNVGGRDRSNFRRVNRIKRYQKGAYPRIKRYGHFGINVKDIQVAFDWYHAHLGIIISDMLRPGGEEGPLLGIFARCDRGAKPADHHSIFFLLADVHSEGVTGLNHVSYEMFDIDDVFMGHEIMEKRGYELEWGVGRHYQGSQIFDYWRSPFHQIHEHQTDGDVFDNTVPPQIVDITQDGDPSNPEMGPSQWGPPINMETFGDKRGV